MHVTVQLKCQNKSSVLLPFPSAPSAPGTPCSPAGPNLRVLERFTVLIKRHVAYLAPQALREVPRLMKK